MMISLQSIARNKDMGVDERESRLVSMIHHACLELGFIYEERKEEYGLFKFKKKTNNADAASAVPKKTKNNKEENKMSKLIIDEVVWKQFGYMIVGIWGMFSPVIALFLTEFSFHWAIILFLTGSWVFIDVFILFYIHYVFKIEPIEKGVDLYVEKEIET